MRRLRVRQTMGPISLRALRVAAYVVIPGRKYNAIRGSVRLLVAGLAVALRARNPGRGAKRGASEQRYRAMPGDVQRLKLPVEPRPATLRYDKVLYGMQEVRGSNPLSSTAFFE